MVAQFGDVGAGGDDDVLRLQCLLLAVLRCDFHLPRRRDAAGADKRLDLLLLEQKRDAVDVRRNGIVLVLHHCRQVKLWRTGHHAERREIMPGLIKNIGRIEQRLRRNAADV